MKTMRKMMMVASLIGMTACGSVEDPATMNDDGSGSDVGSGSDTGSNTGSGSDAGSGSDSMMDAGMPAQPGELTIDSSDFIIENGVWWTTTSGPTLHGTFKGGTGAVVGVKVGAAAPIVATLTGTEWAVSLASGTITTSSTPVVVSLSDADGGHVELGKTLGLDSAPPSISVQASTIRDERADTIDFSTGEPIHTHAGATIHLAATGCPSVYKYAYLMDAAPTFGSATSPNDLAWKFRITDAKLQPGSQQFRVRTDAGATLVSWTALPAPDAAGYSTVKLTRNGGAYPIASLGTRTGQFFIDVRATDWGNLSTTSSFCFDNHPLAAPLAVSAFERGSLFEINTGNDAAVAAMMQWSASVQVVKQRVMQQTAEPVTMTWSAAGSKPTFTAKKAGGWVEEYQYGTQILCPAGNTKPDCIMASTPGYAKASEVSSTGTLQYATYSVTVRDDVSGQVLTTSTTPTVTVTIPARGASEAPHAYSFELTMIGYSELFPEHGWWYGQTSMNTLMGLTYTGDPAISLQRACAQMSDSAFGPYCSKIVTYWDYTAIDQATLSFSPFVATIKTGPDAENLAAPSYVPASTLTSAAFTWDSGDDDLPGPF